ncbi:MAG: LexA family transcriptional regulator [Thermodesulfobacteriota bacterium]
MEFQDFFRRVSQATEISTQKDLAEILGVGPSAITLAKRRGVPKSWSLKIASIFHLNPAWLETGQGPVHQPRQERAFFVPQVSAQACAGAGSFQVQDNIVDEVPFSQPWLRSKGSPENMVTMQIIGDSMSPELEEGDHILVDLSQNQLQAQALYLVGVEDTLQVKRVQSSRGVVLLLSTNHKYPPLTLQGEEIETLRIMGRVLWSSREY